MRALADPTRRSILQLVRDEERTAGQIAESFTISRPAVSQHLRVLTDAGLVEVRRDATKRWYRACPERVEELRDWLTEFWTSGLGELERAAEQEEWPARARPARADRDDAARAARRRQDSA